MIPSKTLYIAVMFLAFLVGCSSGKTGINNPTIPPENYSAGDSFFNGYNPPLNNMNSYRHVSSTFELAADTTSGVPISIPDTNSLPRIEIIRADGALKIKNNGQTVYDVTLVTNSAEIEKINFGILPAGMISSREILIQLHDSSQISAHVEYSEKAFIENDRIRIHASEFTGNIIPGRTTKAISADSVMVGCDLGVEALYPALSEYNLILKGIIEPLGLYEIGITDGRDPYDVVAFLNSVEGLHDAEVESILFPAGFPNDPFFNPAAPEVCRWAFERIRAVDAWDTYNDDLINKNGSAVVENIVFAIPDTGLVYHNDLDLDSFDQYIINTYGSNFVTPGSPVQDTDGHGTSVAGILGARGNNGIHMAGMAWNPYFLPLKVMSANDEYGHVGPVYALLQSLMYVRDLAGYAPFFKFVVNLSLGGYEQTPSVWTIEAVNRLNQRPNVIIIGACGNDKNDKNFAGLPVEISADNFYPAALESVLSVGASSDLSVIGMDREVINEGANQWGTNWGNSVDVCAPGTRSIYTLGHVTPNDIKTYFGGTSASCAFASGLAGLIWSKYPSISKNELRQKIIDSCVPMHLPLEKVGKLGAGRIDALRVFREDRPEAVINDIYWTRSGNPIYGDTIHLSGDGIFSDPSKIPDAGAELNFRWYVDNDFSYPIAMGRETFVYNLPKGDHVFHLKVWEKSQEWNFWDWHKYSDPTTWTQIVTIDDSPLPEDYFDPIYIRAGNFTMGCGPTDPNYGNSGTNDEKPQHTHFVDSFWIRKYEVTNIEFNAFMEADGYNRPELWSEQGWQTKTQYGWTSPMNWWTGNEKGGNPIDFPQTVANPINGISYWEAEAFCRFTQLKLPEEAQWEKAARGDGDPWTYPWGFDWVSNNCNNNSDTIVTSYTAPVGTYSPQGDSPFGLADCAGNVWEWCYEWYEFGIYTQYQAGDYTLPEGGDSKCCRGGGWYYSGSFVTRCSSRYSTALPSTTRNGYVGFRPIAGSD